MKKFLLPVFCLIAASAPAQRLVHGKIVDQYGNPVPRAAILPISIEYISTKLSNYDGEFTLTIPPDAVAVQISHAGCTNGIVQRDLPIDPEARMIVVLSCQRQPEQARVGSIRERQAFRSMVPIDIHDINHTLLHFGYNDLPAALHYTEASFNSIRQTITDGTDHVDPISLRGLGSDQVLVLVNEKRYHKSALVNVNSSVNRGAIGTDLASIPPSAIEAVEILRDGATAQYGSDAIAGVINVRLKRTPGLTAHASYEQAFSVYPKNYFLNRTLLRDYPINDNVKVNDGDTYRFDVTWGTELPRRGFFLATFDVQNRQSVNRAGSFTGTIFPATHNQSDTEILDSLGLTRDAFSMETGNAAMRTAGGMVHFELPVTPRLRFYGNGIVNQKSGRSAGFYRFPAAIPKAVYEQVSQIYPIGFLPQIHTAIGDQSATAGVRYNTNKFQLDGSYTFGRNTFDFEVKNSLNYSQVAVSQTPQREFDSGGLQYQEHIASLNLSRRFVRIPVLDSLEVKAGVEFRHETFGIRAGEEASWRIYTPDSAAINGGAEVFPGFRPENAGIFARTNAAVFLETEAAIGQRFRLGLAYRLENYSDFGFSTTKIRDVEVPGTIKIAGRYAILPNDLLAVRASFNTGFRAPALHQIHYSRTSTLFVSRPQGLIRFDSQTFPNGSNVAKALGIPELRQESSVNYSMGVTARVNKNHEFTLDGYYLTITDRIILTNNFDGTRNPALGAIFNDFDVEAGNFFTNGVDTRSRGIEFGWNSRYSLSNNSSLEFTLSGAFFNNTVVDSAGTNNPFIKASPRLIQLGEVRSYFNREDEGRIESALPQTKIIFSTGYASKYWSLNGRLVFFGQAVYRDVAMQGLQPSQYPVNLLTNERETLDQTLRAKAVVDVSLSRRFGEVWVTVGADNLFDVYPDEATHSNNLSQGRFVYLRRINQMGVNGRVIHFSLRYTPPVKTK